MHWGARRIRMASRFNLRTKTPKVATLFDYMAPGMTNLKMGAPGETMLKKCAEAMKKAAVHRMDQPNSHLLFQYGPETGDRLFLETLAKFLTEEYQSPVDVNDLIATAGATQGLNMITNLFFSPGDLVFVEDPSYFIGIKMLVEDCGMKAISVTMDEQGIIPEELETALQSHYQSHPPRELTEKKPFWSMLYIMPTFHNPTGICLPPERAKKIIDLARKYNLLVVCDDIYNLLYFPEKGLPLERLFTHDDKSDPAYQGNVVSNGSFSKIFGPGIRLGWMEVPLRVKDAITNSGYALSGGGFNHTASGLMTSIISLGILGDLIKESRELLQTRCNAVYDVVRKQLPSASVRKPEGGYFMWIKLPEGLHGDALRQQCEEEHKVTFFQGELSSVTGSFQDYIRISFPFYDEDVLVTAVEQIVKVINNSISQGK